MMIHCNFLAGFSLSIFYLLAIDLLEPVHSAKVDCHPNGKPDREICEDLGCEWLPVMEKAKGSRLVQDHELLFNRTEAAKLVKGGLYPELDIDEPWCFYPDNYVGYKIIDFLDQNTIKLKRVQRSSLPHDIKYLTVRIDSYGYDGAILRLRIFNSLKERYSPELPKLKLHRSKVSQFKYGIDCRNHLIIKRDSNNETLFDTDLGKLIFSRKFIQLNTELASPFLFGLGEHYDSFVKIANRYRPYSFYNTDKVPVAGGQRSYGGFPFYINLNKNYDDSHGVYLHNSNAMDIIVQADRSISFRPTGGILDFFLLIGPKHLDVMKQLQDLVGRPSLPPLWALGFHLGRRGYKSLTELKEVWDRNQDCGIPLETQWIDFTHQETWKEFSYDRERFAGLPEFIERLHDQKKHVMFAVDPGISVADEGSHRPYSLGVEMDIWVKNATNENLIGEANSGAVVFPDFSNPVGSLYWRTLIKEFHEQVKFDGFGLSMNEISNLVDGQLRGCSPDNPIEKMPYRPGGFNLQTKSLCLSARMGKYLEYDTHNLYSQYETIATYKALEATRSGSRPVIISRSSSLGQGHFGGHSSGDLPSSWDYLRWSIPSLIEHSMYGFSLTGSDVCGFAGDTNEQLCARWSTLGAFYTFVRNNNDAETIDQDPASMGPTVLEANRNALNKRYTLLPYLYSLMHRAHKFGEPVIRSVAVQFPIHYEIYDNHNSDILKYEEQFMWGPALMIAPIVHEDTYDKGTYLPRGRWYESSISPERGEFWRPKSIYSSGQRQRSSNISLSDLRLFYFGGHIIPTYPEVRGNIGELVKQPLGLDVALSDEHRAIGKAYLDYGDGLDSKYTLIMMRFAPSGNDTFTLVIRMVRDDAIPEVKLGQVRVMGVFSYINLVTFNETPIESENRDFVLIFDLGGRRLRKNKKIVVRLSRS